MYCPDCGARTPDGAAFCPECGRNMAKGCAARQAASPAREPIAEARPVKHKNERSGGGNARRILFIGASVLALACVVLLGCLLLGGGKMRADTQGLFVCIDDSGATFYDGNCKIIAEDDEFTVAGSVMFDGSIILLRYADEQVAGLAEYKRVTRYGIETVSKETNLFIATATQQGRMIFLEDIEDDVGTLKLFDGKTRETLARDAYLYYCISPDGGTVLYTADYDADDGSFSLYQKSGSRDAVKLGRDLRPIGISDGGKYIYYSKERDGKRTLYALIRGEETKIAEISPTGTTHISFNRSMDEIAISSGGKSYISRRGDEPIRISGDGTKPFFDNAKMALTYVNSSATITYRYNVDSLGGRVWLDNDSIYYVDETFDTVRIDKSVAMRALSADGSTLVWLDDDDELHAARADKRAADSEVTLDEDEIASFRVSDDGRYIYFVNEDDELFVSDAEGKNIVRVDRDVEKYAIVPGTSDCCYIKDYASDAGELMRAQKNGESTAISGGDEAYSLIINGKDLYVGLDYDGTEFDLYRIKKNDLIKVQSGVSSVRAF